MRAIDAVTGHYNANADRHIDVPEWSVDGKPLRVHWRLMTIEQRQKLFSVPDRTDVDIMVSMARDDAGQPMFTLEDKPKLKVAADAAIITRIATKMLGAERITEAQVEAAEKN